MKVTQKSINSFNAGLKPSFNENSNKAKGTHSNKEHVLFSRVQHSNFGVLNKPISMKQVKQFLKDFSNEENDS